MHRALEFTGDSQWHDVEGALHRRIDLVAFVSTGTVQHEINHLIAMTGMPNTDTQALEILCTQMLNQITQTVVPSVTTTFFQTGSARGQIQFIVDDQNL